MRKPIHIRLKSARRARGWSQRKLAEKARVTRSMISHCETGARLPTPRLAARLETLLGIASGTLHPDHEPRKRGAPLWKRRDLWERFTRPLQRYRLERDRENWVRLKAARRLSERLYLECVSRILRVHGRRAFREWLYYACADSGLEMMVWLRLLAGLALISYRAIPTLGWDRLAILEQSTGAIVGHRLWPALLYAQPVPIALFPQVSFLGLGIRVDFLVCVRLPEGLRWLHLEVDGVGHDASKDDERTCKLGLPRIRITERDVLAPDFEQALIDRLVRAAREAA